METVKRCLVLCFVLLVCAEAQAAKVRVHYIASSFFLPGTYAFNLKLKFTNLQTGAVSGPNTTRETLTVVSPGVSAGQEIIAASWQIGDSGTTPRGVTDMWFETRPDGGMIVDHFFSFPNQGPDVEIYVTVHPASCPPRGLVHFKLDGQIGGPHAQKTLQFVLDGVVKAEFYVPANEFNTVLNGTWTTPANGEFTYAWRLNGQPIAAGSYGCGDEIIDNRVNSVANVGPDIPPDPDPDPDPTPDPQPTPPPGGETEAPVAGGPGGSPVGGSTPDSPTVPGPMGPPGPAGQGGTSGGGENLSGDVNVINTNDFYAPFLKALQDFGKEGTIGNVGSTPTMDANIKGESMWGTKPTTPDADGAESAVTDALAVLKTAPDDLVSKLPTAPQLPTGGLGFQYVYSLALELPVVGTRSFSVNLTPYAGAIQTIRTIVELVMTCGFFVAAVRTVRGAFA